MTSYLQIKNLCAESDGGVKILRSVSLEVDTGKVHGLVGESGAGKSMIGKAILGIMPKAINITSGEIWLDGVNLLDLPPAKLRHQIGATTALISQDPMTALNPSKRVGLQIANRLVEILKWNKKDAQSRTIEMLAEVHISEPERVMRQYPHELSGGMRQRILIASAFAAEPKLIIADEPTTALDVMVQKQILRLIAELQEKHGTALLFVSHDLGVVSKVCNSLSVLYGGMVVENADMREFFAKPENPYSRALLAATPSYEDPTSSLIPVPQTVINGVDGQLAAYDKEVAEGGRP